MLNLKPRPPLVVPFEFFSLATNKFLESRISNVSEQKPDPKLLNSYRLTT